VRSAVPHIKTSDVEHFNSILSEALVQCMNSMLTHSRRERITEREQYQMTYVMFDVTYEGAFSEMMIVQLNDTTRSEKTNNYDAYQLNPPNLVRS
jgi:hypothetical protein